MQHSNANGTVNGGGLFLFFGLLWVMGALFFVSMATLGSSRVGVAVPDSNATPVANSPASQ